MKKDFKLNDNGDLIITGCATSSTKKHDGAIYAITPNAVSLSWSKGAWPMTVEHKQDANYRNKFIGKVLSYKYFPTDFVLDTPAMINMKLDIIALITDRAAIEDIINRRFVDFSIDYNIINHFINPRTKQRIVTEARINDITITKAGNNPDCKFEIVNTDKVLASFGLDKENLNIYGKKVKIQEVYKDSNNQLKAKFQASVKDSYIAPLSDFLPNNVFILNRQFKKTNNISKKFDHKIKII